MKYSQIFLLRVYNYQIFVVLIHSKYHFNQRIFLVLAAILISNPLLKKPNNDEAI